VGDGARHHVRCSDVHYSLDQPVTASQGVNIRNITTRRTPITGMSYELTNPTTPGTHIRNGRALPSRRGRGTHERYRRWLPGAPRATHGRAPRLDQQVTITLEDVVKRIEKPAKN
jgi:hypothetical protein